jgi:hypothetical protein
LFTEMVACIVTAKRQAMISNRQQVDVSVQESDSTFNDNIENMDEDDGDNEFDFVLSQGSIIEMLLY